MKKNKIFGIGVGTTSVMLMFVIVCIMMLAIMSYMIVKTDTDVVDKKASYSIRYQMADSVAVETLAKIDEKLYEISRRNIDFSNINECRVYMDSLSGVNVDYNKQQLSYKVGLDDKTNLEVILQVNTTNNKKVRSKKRYSILRWKIVTESKDIGNDNLNVWK